MGLRMKTFIFGAFNENLMFRGAQFTKNGYREGDCPKREALTVCRCKGVRGGRGVLGKKERVVFLKED